jgi:hypothetical protein
VQLDLLRQGQSYSDRGASPRDGSGPIRLVVNPLPITREEIGSTIQKVMSLTIPAAITQEQILRGAFFAHLPAALGLSIGTAESAVHPERPTPSSDYSFTGKRPMRARYDLGFGHPTSSPEIAGVMELKAGFGTFDRLRALSRVVVDADAVTSEAVKPKPKEEPLFLDILKLLDPLAPESSFRISWIALAKRGRAERSEVYDRAAHIVGLVAQRRKMNRAEYGIDPGTGWMTFTWTQPAMRLDLAWYQPQIEDSSRFEVVF